MTSFKESKVGKVAIDVTTSGLYLIFILFNVLRDQYDKVNYMMSSPKKKNDNNSSIPEAPPPPTFKEQLDQEAIDSRVHQHESEEHSTVKDIVDKISHAIPAVAPLIGGSNPEHKEEEHKEVPPGPPNRPEHDTQIEEFVREQHRSNGIENLSEGKS
ncbi:hypothetical protein T069G_00421 [Trichoderma breve]|uniref:Uncharacterized protein n=1 Tax=Trichoderma breve TaxID=2034170 RepID=A0A9W9EBW7_9HYPO|nr:hypothetical protein T069G_00421 [Trichoderma breve]KAJ4863891.1 hypothetical protein T069G_00421 [Trichoderma breve]